MSETALHGRVAAFRRRLYDVLDHGMRDPVAIALHRLLIALVVVSIAAVVLESVPWMRQRFGPLFTAIEVVTLALFTIEFAARLWVAIDHPPYRDFSPWRARLAFLHSPGAIIDLVAIVPAFLAFIVDEQGVRILLLLRLLRFLKLTRYSPGVRSLLEAVQSERRALLACVMFVGCAMLISASFMYLVESEAQPDKFGTIPDAMYWAIITLTTVGYGDVFPVTALGRVVAGLTAFMGLVTLALPIGIIATSFAQVIQRRDFVVTWSMVARVPLFNELTATEIVEIMRYLHSQSVAPGEAVVQHGERGDCMFFIASGEVEVELEPQPVKLSEGHFFGEIALLRHAGRSATVRACTKTKLLVLDSADLNSVMQRKPHIAEVIQRIARERRLPDAA